MKHGSRLVVTIWTCDAVVYDVPFGGPQYTVMGEKIFLYHHACHSGVTRLRVLFFDFVDDSGFSTDTEIVVDQLAYLGECIVDAVAHLEVVFAQ